jgi:hypothetical protein
MDAMFHEDEVGVVELDQPFDQYTARAVQRRRVGEVGLNSITLQYYRIVVVVHGIYVR